MRDRVFGKFGEEAYELRCFGAKSAKSLKDEGNELGVERDGERGVFGGLGGGMTVGNSKGCGRDGEVGRGTRVADADVESRAGVSKEGMDVGTRVQVRGFDL